MQYKSQWCCYLLSKLIWKNIFCLRVFFIVMLQQWYTYELSSYLKKINFYCRVSMSQENVTGWRSRRTTWSRGRWPTQQILWCWGRTSEQEIKVHFFTHVSKYSKYHMYGNYLPMLNTFQHPWWLWREVHIFRFVYLLWKWQKDI